MEKKVIAFNKNLRGENKMDFKAGDVVKIHLRIKEGEKQRLQMFEGLIIAVKGRQSSSPTITVRKVSHGVGVEMIVPLLSKNVEKIELVKKAKVRRAKLNYIRDLTPKQSRMKYKVLKEAIGEKDEQKNTEVKQNDTELKEAVVEKVEEKEEEKK